MIVLAQVDPKAAADGLVGPAALGWIIVGLVIALVAVVRAYVVLSRENKAELATREKEARETAKADAKEQREMLMQIVPLSAKLTEGLESLERITDRLTRE